MAELLDRWRIDDEWWRPAVEDGEAAESNDAYGRREVSRMYFHIALENGRLLTVFHDLIGDGWYLQTTARA